MVSEAEAGQGVNLKARGRIGAAVGTALVAFFALALGASDAVASPPTIVAKQIAVVSATAAVLEAEVTTGAKATKYHFEYDTSKYGEGEGPHGTSTPEVQLLAGESPKLISATIEGLQPGTIYHFRAVAKNLEGEAVSADRAFATSATAIGALPDSRAYEQASPIDKNGGDALGIVPFVKAAFGGEGITYASTSGVPGGVGAQELPLYLASRTGAGAEAEWNTQGLLPPASLGPKAKVMGWTPDFSRVFQQATNFGAAPTTALFERRQGGGEPIAITPYVPKSGYAYAGASSDGSQAIFESSSGQLGTTPAGREGRSNVYAWDGEGEQLSLASVFNDGKVPTQGAFAGPYEWVLHRTSEGGASRLYYTQGEHAVAADGSVFFTTAGNGHIYLREHPSQPQSAMAGQACKEATKACTLDVSGSKRTPPDPSGSRPAAFQVASADGQNAFFTSPEELTDNAQTGPEVEAPKIGRVSLGAPPEEKAEEALEELLSAHHAAGVAVDGECIYWADPVEGTIGRAKLNGANPPSEIEAAFITPGETSFETHPETEPGVIHSAPSTPRYVAAQGEYVYWTNTGPLGGDGNKKQLEDPVRGAGTIGRAKLAATCGALEVDSIEPEFIAGASNPKGIAVNASHIYWANSLKTELVSERDIARAEIGGGKVEQHFFELLDTALPYGVALSATHVYWAVETSGGFANVASIPLEGAPKGSEKEAGVSEGIAGAKARGIAVAGPHVYWAAQGREEIGRVNLALDESSVEIDFLKVKGSLVGLAADPAESHLFWSVNGEVPPHSGNDLYRYQASSNTLIDISAEPSAENGAEVQGVLGASADGTRVYFVANGVLDEAEEAIPGSCQGGLGGGGVSGRCNLYLWEEDGTAEGRITFIARLNAAGDLSGDSLNWTPTISDTIFPGGAQRTSQLSDDGETLLFRSREKLSEYDSGGTPELYLYRVGGGPINCVSCKPSGAAPAGQPSLGSIVPSALRSPFTSAVASHNLSDEGRRVFFETPDALAPEDINGEGGCPAVGAPLQKFPACMDVYEWEAPETGSCKEGAPSYSPQDEGCLYLISTGKSEWASLMGDASASGDDVFFFTREGLVGQDKDELLDVYDAKVNGGIASQSPVAPTICAALEACHGSTSQPPAEAAGGSASFRGPANPKPKRGHPKKHHKKHKKHHKKHHSAKSAKRRADANREAGR
jgi:hypothetical protein